MPRSKSVSTTAIASLPLTQSKQSIENTYYIEKKSNFWITIQSFAATSATRSILGNEHSRLKILMTLTASKFALSSKKNARSAMGNYWRPNYEKPLKRLASQDESQIQFSALFAAPKSMTQACKLQLENRFTSRLTKRASIKT